MADGELPQIGSYITTKLLGVSSTSRYYLSKSLKPKRDAVHIKLLSVPLESAEAKYAFMQRVKQLKKLASRNIVAIHDGNLNGDYGYLVLDAVSGETMRHMHTSGKQLPLDEAKRLLSPLADALNQAHINNIVHGNLHPGNISLSLQRQPLLTEFSLTVPGITPLLDDEAFAIPYMSPEQLRGQAITPASDQYALAAMLYEWLCGRRPYDATERDMLVEQQERSPLPLPSTLNSAIKPAIEQVLLQALSLEPEKRFANVHLFSTSYLHALMGLPAPKEQLPLTTRLGTNSSHSLLTPNTNPRTGIENISPANTLPSSASAPTLLKTIKTLKSDNISDKQLAKSTSVTSRISYTESTLNNEPSIEQEKENLLSKKSKLLNDRYQILNEVGNGGFGSVYRCEDTKLANRTLAIKKLLLNKQQEHQKIESVQLFKQEAEVLAELQHSNLPRIYETFNEGDCYYIVMDFIEGETLESIVNRDKKHFSLEEIIDLGITLCSILHYLHNHQPPIIFRDLKPSNIMIRHDGELFLIDFGIARYFKPDKLKDTIALGTIGYAAPEQFGKLTTIKSDIYSLGAILHFLLSGNDPSIKPLEFISFKTGDNQILDELEDLIMEMVDREPSNRPSTILQVKERLQAIKQYVENNQVKHNLKSKKLILPASTGSIYNAPTEDLRKPKSLSTTNKSKKADTPINNASQSSLELQTIVTEDLRNGGILSRKLPQYEERLAQIEMATLVSRSLMQGVPALIEAGTGTGKSLAYLVPAVRSGKVAIISTANKALQEQLFYKDIPFVQQHIKDFEAALVKGVGNYVCLDRLESERVGMQFYAKNTDFKRLVDITNDPEAEFTGDFETLGFQLSSDIRSKVATDSDQCAWSKCGYFADCYVRQMRENAERAQVIVVNHTLLLLDAAMGGFLLPERDVIILDEAHHLEEEATRSFTITIGPNQIQTLLAQKLLRNHSQLSLQDEAMRISAATWMRLSQVADPGYKGRINLEAPLEEGLKLATVIGDLADSLRKQRPKDLPDKEGQLYDKLLKRTQNLSENIRTVFSVAQPTQFVYYVERVQTGGGRANASNVQLQVSAAPLDVTNWLKERLFDKCNVICTSATLATIGPDPAHPEVKGPNFSYFRKRIGLDALERPDVLECILPLAFDYEQNALLYIPRDLPAPAFGAGSDEYMKAIAREMYKLVKASRGRAFLLFSSKRMLDRAYELMSPHLPYPLLKQGDMTRLELTRRFREEEGSVLFGLKSFWEGVDIAGEALSLVVIDKLPFDPPDDPVHEARVAQMKAAGENWFGTYVLPQAVLRLKQGIGRLLRTREDRGVMAILDTRLHTKGYGKMVLDAMPPAKRTTNIRDVERFFA